MTTRSGLVYKKCAIRPNMEENVEGAPAAAPIGEAGDATAAMVAMLREQQQAQQALMMRLMDQQREEMGRYRRELEELRRENAEPPPQRVKLPKPTLQKLAHKDDIENFLQTFERIARQQEWPEAAWATQLAGLLTGKAMAAYAALNAEDAESYEAVKRAVLQRYEVNDESRRVRFRNGRKSSDESFGAWSDRMQDDFVRWTKDLEMPLDQVIMLEQFLRCVSADLAVWIRERKPKSLKEAAVLADDYALARKGGTGTPSWRAPQPGSDPRPQLRPDTTPFGRGRPVPPKPFVSGRLASPNERSRTNEKGEKKCFHCRQWGHLMYSCPNKQKTSPPEATQGFFGDACGEVAWNANSEKFLRRGTLDGTPVQMLIDTGCDRTMVSQRMVKPAQINPDKKVPVLCVHGDTVFYPTASVKLQMGDWWTETEATVAPQLPVDVLLGRDVYGLSTPNAEAEAFAVVTRSKAKKTREEDGLPLRLENGQEIRGKVNDLPLDPTIGQEQRGKEDDPPEEAAELDVLQATPAELRRLQQEDTSLISVREKAGGAEDGTRVYFYYQAGLLYRHWSPQKEDREVQACNQLVLPQPCRGVVLRLAHDIPMAGHLGITKTKDRILQRYYWPGVFKDVAEYCRTCEVCQRSHPRKPARAEMIPMPLVSKPFQRIAMDIIGPLPRTKRGNRFILTICDYATRYPEAIALPSTEATRVAQELMVVFSRMGVPDEILTDQGTNFMSALLADIYQMLQINRIRTTPYHPQTDGLVERFNGTLKSMLRKFVSRTEKDWDDYLPLVCLPRSSPGIYWILALRALVRTQGSRAPRCPEGVMDWRD